MAEVVRLEAALAPVLGARVRPLAEGQVRARVSDVMVLRPDLASHVALGLLGSGLLGEGLAAFRGLRDRIGHPLTGFSDPERCLVDLAIVAVGRHLDLLESHPAYRAVVTRESATDVEAVTR